MKSHHRKQRASNRGVKVSDQAPRPVKRNRSRVADEAQTFIHGGKPSHKTKLVGKVQGHAPPKRADRRPRNGGGRIPAAANDNLPDFETRLRDEMRRWTVQNGVGLRPANDNGFGVIPGGR